MNFAGWVRAPKSRRPLSPCLRGEAATSLDPEDSKSQKAKPTWLSPKRKVESPSAGFTISVSNPEAWGDRS